MSTRRAALIVDLVSRAGGGISYLHNVAAAFEEASGFEYEYTFLCHPATRASTTLLSRHARVEFGPEDMPRGGLRGFWWRRRHLKEILAPYNPDVVLFMNECPIRLEWPTVLFLRNALYFARSQEVMHGRYPAKQWVRCTYLRMQSLRSINNADVVVTASRSFSDMIRHDTRNRSLPISIAPFGTNLSTVCRARRPYERCRTLLCLQYNFYKEHETAIRALAVLRERFPQVQMTVSDDLAGHRLPQARAAAAIIDELEIREAVRCVGTIPHSQMADAYAQSDIFLFPSLLESFGHGLLEAMANGMPCVVTDIPVFREIAGDTVLYHPPRDSHVLAAQVARLIDDRGLRESLGKRAQKRAKTYTWHTHIAALENAFDSCIRQYANVRKKPCTKADGQ